MKPFLFAIVIGLTSLLALNGCSTSGAGHISYAHTLPLSWDEIKYQPPGKTLTIATLNIAHGRGENFSQVFTTTASHRKNLTAIARFIEKNQIDLIALQELDAPSKWSGGFDHLEFIAKKANLPVYVRTNHMDHYIATYGTGILSKLPFLSASGLTFSPSPPTTRKGFTITEVLWAESGQDSTSIDFVSLHLDFLRESIREKQIAELKEFVSNRARPIALMGDFNSEKLVHKLISSGLSAVTPLKSCPPTQSDVNTFNNSRIDWILVSNEIEFVDCSVDASPPSDHRAVIARIRISNRVNTQ